MSVIIHSNHQGTSVRAALEESSEYLGVIRLAGTAGRAPDPDADFCRHIKFDGDDGHEQEVGVTMAGIAQVFRIDAVIGELEAEVAGNINESLVRRETECSCLAPHA